MNRQECIEMLEEWNKDSTISKEFIERWNLGVDPYAGASMETVIYQIQREIIIKALGVMREEEVEKCTSFGADPDLKPGPLTQDDRGWIPN